MKDLELVDSGKEGEHIGMYLFAVNKDFASVTVDANGERATILFEPNEAAKMRDWLTGWLREVRR